MWFPGYNYSLYGPILMKLKERPSLRIAYGVCRIKVKVTVTQVVKSHLLNILNVDKVISLKLC